MKKLFALALLPLVSACVVDGGYYAGPVQGEFSFPPARYIVIENLNAPGECHIVRHDTIFAAVYRVSYGPASHEDVVSWANEYCRSPE